MGRHSSRADDPAPYRPNGHQDGSDDQTRVIGPPITDGLPPGVPEDDGSEINWFASDDRPTDTTWLRHEDDAPVQPTGRRVPRMARPHTGPPETPPRRATDTGSFFDPRATGSGYFRSESAVDPSHFRGARASDSGSFRTERATDTGEVRRVRAEDSGSFRAARETDSGYFRARHSGDSGSFRTARAEDSGSFRTARAEDSGSFRTQRAGDSGSFRAQRAGDSGSFKSHRAGDTGSFRANRADGSGSFRAVKAEDTGSLRTRRAEDSGSFRTAGDSGSYRTLRAGDSGTHRAVGPALKRRRISAWPIAAAVAVVLLVLGWFAWGWADNLLNSRAEAQATGCPDGNSSIMIVVTPAAEKPVAAAAAKWNAANTVVHAHCIHVGVRSAPSQQVLDVLSGKAGTMDSIGGVPTGWIPEASIWVSQLTTAKPELVGSAAQSVASARSADYPFLALSGNGIDDIQKRAVQTFRDFLKQPAQQADFANAGLKAT